MQTLCIRVDYIDSTTFPNLIEWIKGHSQKAFLYEENGAKTHKLHAQGCIDLDLSSKKLSAWAKNLKDLIKPTYKNAYSLTVMKKESYKCYCAKDKKKLFYIGYLEDELVEYENNSYKDNDKNTYTEKFLKYISTRFEFYERYEKFYMSDILYDQRTDKESIKQVITRDVVAYIVETSKLFDKFILTRFVTTAFYHYKYRSSGRDEKWIKDMSYEISNSI